MRQLLLCLLVVLVPNTAIPGTEDRPNIIIIVADDLGWHDVGYHGSEIPTPHLDRLAREGMRLEQHYVFPVCSPTRAALLSGRYATRFGLDRPTNGRVFPFDTVTLAKALQGVGYTTALVGKWHLGSRPQWGPNHFGFDHSYGLLAGGCGPYCHRYQAGPFSRSWHRNGQFLEETGHVTDLLTAEGLRFIEANHDRPFFLYLPYTAPHIPLDEPDKWLKANQHIEDPGKRLYAAAVTHLDDAVGQVAAKLKQLKIEGKTFVLFFSDNGAHGPDRNDREFKGQYPNLQISGNNTPLRGGKGFLYEGGLRTPALVWWPGRLKSAQVNTPINVVDWMPTLCTLTGCRVQDDPKWDGRDIWPVLMDHATNETRTFYWGTTRWVQGQRRSLEQALRHGDWKLIVDWQGNSELYNLARDPQEKQNLAQRHPQRVIELKKRLAQASQRDNDAVVADSPAVTSKTILKEPKRKPKILFLQATGSGSGDAFTLENVIE